MRGSSRGRSSLPIQVSSSFCFRLIDLARPLAPTGGCVGPAYVTASGQ